MAEFVVKYWVEAVFTLIVSLMSWGYKGQLKKLKEKQKEMDALRKGMKAILHDRLMQSGMYYIERGYIYASELERYEALYVVYHDLFHWNGTGEEIHERVKELEIKKGV